MAISVRIKKYFGYVVGVLCEKVGYITCLHIDEKYRGKGHGTYLVLQFIIMAYDNGCVGVRLSDMSNNYMKENNIYKKIGFKYYRKDDPDMYVSTRKVIIKYKMSYSNIQKRYNK